MADMNGLDYMIANATPSKFVIRVYRSANSSLNSPTAIPNPANFKFNYMVIE
jgi:hypothetical protein